MLPPLIYGSDRTGANMETFPHGALRELSETALMKCMRLSLRKGAHVDLSGAA
jgi:hypothetical protein